MSSEAVYAKFVEANPATDVDALHAARPDVDDVLDALGASDRPGPVRPGAPIGGRRVRTPGAWIAAGVTFMIVLAIGGAWMLWWGGRDAADVADPVEVLRRDAVATAEQWIAALNTGDIDSVMALSLTEAATPSDRRVHEWVAGFAANGMPTELIACDAVSATESSALVDCRVHLTDPVAVELGVADLVAPFFYSDGRLAWQPYRGGDVSLVNAAYADFLTEFRQSVYERSCAPAAYEPGTIIQDRALALTGECAAVAAPLADEVADWIGRGRPGSDD